MSPSHVEHPPRPPWMAYTLRGRVRRFFIGGEEWAIESAKSPESLKADIRRGLVGRLSVQPGVKGYVLGSSVHLGVAITWAWLQDDTVFRGRIEATPAGGSRVRGRFTAGRFNQVYAVFYFGLLLFFAVMLFASVVPVFCFLLAWHGTGHMGWPSKEVEQKLRDNLSAACGPPTHAEENRPC